MSSKWITALMIIFMGYALITQKTRSTTVATASPIALQVKEEKHEIIDKIKAYAEFVTADPKANSLIDKNKPLINQDNDSLVNASPQNTVGIATKAISLNASSLTPTYVNPSTISPQKGSTDFGIVQNKIYNALYNALQTKPGKELLERFLTTPREEVNSETKTSEPNPYNNNSLLEVIEGEGKEAECGDIATVHYITRLVNGQEIENTRLNNKPRTFQIGDRKVIKGIEYAILGMKKAGIRRLIIPPRLAYNSAEFSKNLVSDNEFVTIDIELIDLKFALEDWTKQITIFQKPDENNGARMLCSNEVYFNYKISTAHEQVLSSSREPVHFILGSSQVPAAINKAFSGIRSNSKRIVMIPSSLIYNKKVSFFPTNIKLPAKAMLIFEIKAGSSETKQKSQ